MRKDEFPIIDSYVKKEINAVFADIRAEIAEIKQLMTEQDCEPSFIRGLEQAVNVIDAHIKGVKE